jgi:hypothetical protein
MGRPTSTRGATRRVRWGVGVPLQENPLGAPLDAAWGGDSGAEPGAGLDFGAAAVAAGAETAGSGSGGA